MNISQAAIQSGLPVKTLRYYEEIGLIKPARALGNDYRSYSSADIEHLQFLQRARTVGFSLDVCRELLDLYRDESRRGSQVRMLMVEKISQIELQLQELHALKSILSDIANSCVDDDSAGQTINPVAPPKPSLMPFMLVES